jgi:predicted GIY-YIG superfamily endonuclease
MYDSRKIAKYQLPVNFADGVEIRRFLTEFSPYIRIMNYTKKEELAKIAKGYMDGEFVTYEEYLKTKETVGNSDEKLDLEAMLSGDGDESYDEEEVKINTDKSTKDTVVKSDVSLYTKKVHTSIKDAISYVSHVKTLKDTGKIALVTPKKEELTELEESLKNLLKNIEELKNN